MTKIPRIAVGFMALSLVFFPLAGDIGARAQTINVEVDFMVQPGDHSHRPNLIEMNAVVQMFFCQGVTLNVVIDDAIAHVDAIDGPEFGWFSGAEFQAIKAANFDGGAGWHYCVFAHNFSEDGVLKHNGGIGELNGDDFLVSLGSGTGEVGTAWDRADVFAHELGHNLGLEHAGGIQNEDIVGPYKPNYASVMSYQFSYRGVRNHLIDMGLADETSLYKQLDYSNGRMPWLNENALDETVGVGMHKVNWNCDGGINTTGTVSHDLDGRPWCDASGDLQVLWDNNDWADIVIASKASFAERSAPGKQTVICFDQEEIQRYKNYLIARFGPEAAIQPPVTIEPCVAGLMIWVDIDNLGAETGTGRFPFRRIADAYNAAPDGSVLLLQPGTYGNGQVMLFEKPMTLAGPGGALISP